MRKSDEEHILRYQRLSADRYDYKNDEEKEEMEEEKEVEEKEKEEKKEKEKKKEKTEEKKEGRGQIRSHPLELASGYQLLLSG